MTNKEALVPVALHKLIAPPKYKKLVPDIAPGEYPIELQIRILGSLKKGEPFTQRIAAKANPWAIAALALSKLNGVSMDALVRESIAVPRETQDAIKEQATQALQKIVDSTRTEMEGRVTANLVHEVL